MVLFLQRDRMSRSGGFAPTAPTSADQSAKLKQSPRHDE